MHIPYRECLQCGGIIEGRPNKKFCSDTCKGRHFRDNNPPSEADSSPSISPHPIDPNSSHYYKATESKESINDLVASTLKRMKWEDEERKEREGAERKVKADKEQVTKLREQATQLHQQFCDIVQEFLDAEGTVLKARPVSTFLEKLNDFISLYREHPYLKMPGNSMPSRLKELYAIQDIIGEVEQEIADLNAFHAKEGSFEITKKSRKLLRELLIAD
ncbi:hypothetical protein ACW9KT_08705 [Hymenobacter sp. HD11105]